MQIIVLGPHRSGTSAVTRLINMMGAYFDSGQASIGFNEENPKGFWERSDVIALNDRLLAEEHSSWDRLAHWGEKVASEPPALPAIRHDIKRLVLDLDAHRPWVLKDPRLCLTFSHWRALLEVPVVISVYRDPLEVAISMANRNGFSVAHGLAIWEYYTVALLNACRGLPLIFVEYANLLKDPVASSSALHEALAAHGVQGLRMPNDKEINAFIEPSLYRSKTNAFTFHNSLTPYQQALGAMAKGEKPLPLEPLEISPFARDIMQMIEEKQACLGQIERLREAEREKSHLLAEAARREESSLSEAREREEQYRRSSENNEQARLIREGEWETLLQAESERHAAAEAREREALEQLRQKDEQLQQGRQRIEDAARANETLATLNAELSQRLGTKEFELSQMRASTSWKVGSTAVRLLTFLKRRPRDV